MKPYLSTHSHSHIVLILLSALLGAVVMGLIVYYPQAHNAVAPPVSAQGPGLAAFEEVFVDVSARVTPAVVTIFAETVTRERQAPSMRDLFRDLPPWFQLPEPETEPRERRTPVLGSGWIYTADGYIVTNAHVVSGARDIKVKLNDIENDVREYPAQVVGTDPRTELAVIKIDAPRRLPTLALGDSNSLRIGQWVMAAGAPFRYEQTVTAGIVSAKGRELRGESRYIQLGDIIQTDASINPGNSGGPLVDLRGNVVGINVAIAAAGPTPANVGIGFAIAADTAKAIVPELIAKGRVTRGYLGISIRDLTANQREFFGVPDGGVLVEGISENQPASRSDLRVWDVIVGVNGRRITDTYSLQTAVGNTPPGTEVTLDVVRDKQTVQVKVTLGELPAQYAGLEEPSGEAPGPTETPQPRDAARATALGITVAAATPEVAAELGIQARQGVVIVAVADDSPAAGTLDRGMLVTRINRDTIETLDDFTRAMAAAKESGLEYVIIQVLISDNGEPVASTVEIPLSR